MPYLTPETPTGFVRMAVNVPDTLLPHFVGAIARLWDEDHWEQFGTLTVPDTLQYIANMILELESDTVTVQYPKQPSLDFFFPGNYNNPIERGEHSSTWNRAYMRIPNTQGSYAEWYIEAEEGEYQFQLICAKFTSTGKFTLSIDGVEKGTGDTYTAVSSYNNIFTIYPVSIVGSGQHTLRLSVNDKNAASSGYSVYINGITLAKRD